MRLKLRRKSVYVATIVAIFAMLGGFAVATLGNFSTVSSNQNTVSSTLGNTVWNGATASLAPSYVIVGVTCATAPTFSGATASTQNACINVSTNAAESTIGATNHYVEEFTFTLAVTTTTPAACVSPTVCSDTFAVSFVTSTGNGAVAYTVSLTDPTTTGGNDLLNIYLDFGASAPTSITAMDVVATGS